MKKFLYIFFISILFISCSEKTDSKQLKFEFPDGTTAVYNVDNELKERVKPFIKLFDGTLAPIDKDIELFSMVDKDSIVRGSCFFYRDNKCLGIVFNYHYEIDDNVIIHELCHAALKCHNMNSHSHDTLEWNYLCDYFEKLGYNPIRTGAADYPVKIME